MSFFNKFPSEPLRAPQSPFPEEAYPVVRSALLLFRRTPFCRRPAASEPLALRIFGPRPAGLLRRPFGLEKIGALRMGLGNGMEPFRLPVSP